MGGGLMQLVAYGAQDIYLTGNPQITFFKLVYRRHTNFSMEAIQQTWSGEEGGFTEASCTATISRNGDLVSRMYLELFGATPLGPPGEPGEVHVANPGSSGIVSVEVEIGGQTIDKQSGMWMETWVQLTEPNHSAHTGRVGGIYTEATTFQNMSGMGGALGHNTTQKSTFYVPLQFWFCRHPGLALPLIALQYHEVKIILNHKFSNGYKTPTPELPFGNINNQLWCDYIYLDTDERRRFAQVSHEYLIEQVQEQTLSNPSGTNDLYFNHPVKELIWIRQDDPDTPRETTAICDDMHIRTRTYQLKLNGHDRFAARTVSYFTRVQVWQYHTGPGGLVASGEHTSPAAPRSDGIAVYSFALKPEEHQPSGTCNFSRIDSAQLVGQAGCMADIIYAVNYNVLRIMSGMGGLAYSN
jgi:hypothetical protein